MNIFFDRHITRPASRNSNDWLIDQSIAVFCKAIEPLAGEALCRLFPIDQQVDLHAIALKSREAMDKRGLNPHELYKRAELKRLAAVPFVAVR